MRVGLSRSVCTGVTTAVWPQHHRVVRCHTRSFTRTCGWVGGGVRGCVSVCLCEGGSRGGRDTAHFSCALYFCVCVCVCASDGLLYRGVCVCVCCGYLRACKRCDARGGWCFSQGLPPICCLTALPTSVETLRRLQNVPEGEKNPTH